MHGSATDQNRQSAWKLPSDDGRLHQWIRLCAGANLNWRARNRRRVL